MSIRQRIHKTGSISMKLVIIGFMIIVVFLPAFLMVRGLIEERADRQEETVYEVTSKWGQQQTISGPVLVVPYLNTYGSSKYAYFLPDNLTIEGNLNSEIRSRGIFDVPLYEGDFTLKGSFSKPDFASTGIGNISIYWDQSFVAIGIPDMRGVMEQVKIDWGGDESTLNSGVKSGIFNSGISALVPIDPESGGNYDFSFNLKLRGSEELYFMPLGDETTVSVTSDWLNPSFDGAFLPIEHNIDTSGFTASWSVLDLNRTFPQQWTSEDGIYLSQTDAFGVKFYLPVDVYQKTERSAKYAIAVITLVFVVFFLVEIISKRRIHPFQYLMIGLALVIFYTLLLSLSEHIRFGLAYLVSSVSIILMVTLFSRSVMKKTSLGLTTGGILTLLYVFIYVLLQMQDFTLLIGSIGIFVILAVVMYVSKFIDWYGKEESQVY